MGKSNSQVGNPPLVGTCEPFEFHLGHSRVTCVIKPLLKTNELVDAL